MQILVKRDLLWHENVHHIADLVVAHALDRQKVWRVELPERVCLPEYFIYDLRLDHLE